MLTGRNTSRTRPSDRPSVCGF